MGRTDWPIALNPTVHFWLKNVIVYIDSAVWLVPINHITHPRMHKYTFPQPGWRSLYAHSSAFPAPPSPTHHSHRGWSRQDQSRLSVSSISVPHLWQMITISGPLGELPVAPWPCLLVPSSPCLHLLTCLKISALALTLQCSSVLIVFYSGWSRPTWRSFNTQLGQRTESQPWSAWSRYTISICWNMLNELGNWILPMVLSDLLVDLTGFWVYLIYWASIRALLINLS